LWDLQIEYVVGGATFSTSLSPDKYFRGTETEAKAETKRRAMEWEKKPENYHCAWFKICPVLYSVSTQYKKKEGWPLYGNKVNIHPSELPKD